ncbi:response regulator [Cohnella cellulosilytica]|uniref:Response regulator n=1 Tax=Cohnella cellulosilytica TaxID=986710 RepID=A0ABW2FHH1_9BACL
MIRVLVVDDDKLVRKGLISAMPWKQFGMEVAGEANNGDNALKFMEAHPVDLLMTDLSMPVMSGIELMRIVRERYPHVQIVVLTLHRDFEYIQEALRLGAIDYIAKIQLEKEQFEEVLGRISRLWKQKERQQLQSGRSDPDAEWEAGAPEALRVLYALHPQGEHIRQEALPGQAVEAEPGIWYWPADAAADDGSSPETNDAVAAMTLIGLQGMSRKAVLQLLRSYRKHDLFYDYDPASPSYTVNARDVLERDGGEPSPSMETISEQWGAAEWIYEDEAFRRMLRELKALRLPAVRLIRIFISLSDEWNRLYRPLLAQPIAMEDYFASWHGFRLWLTEVREQIREAGGKPQFSAEIRGSLDKAMSLARQHVGEPISTGEIAQTVNMSSSYFSQCFKLYTGQSYADYVRNIRIEQAKGFLRNTTRTIQWIAEQCGYSDEKYFSRLFREQTGLLPSEYRQRNEL